MDEEYDVIVLGTGLTVSIQAVIPQQTGKRTLSNCHVVIFCSAQAFNPLSMHPEVKAFHIPCALMSLYGCNNNKYA